MATPQERREAINQGVLKARSQYQKYTVAQEEKIFGLLKQSADSITEKILAAEVAGKIPAPRLVPLLQNIADEMATLRPGIKGQITAGMKRAIDYGLKSQIEGAEMAGLLRVKTGIGTSFKSPAGKIIRNDLKEEEYAKSRWGEINDRAMAFLVKYQPGATTLSDKIWDLTWSAEKSIRNAVQLGVLQGQSAAGLSRTVRQYLVQPLTLRGKAKELARPGVGVYKSAYQNAMRLARTEYQRAFNEGIFEYAKEKSWVIGYTWHAAGSNPCEECEALDGDFYDKGDEPEIPLHPNCYSGDTEIYTNEGWKLFRDLRGDEKILSLNPDDFNLDCLPIKHRIEYRFEGKLIYFHNRNFDLLVTPNHRMFVGKRNYLHDRQKKKFYFIEAKNLNGEFHIYRSSKWKGIEKEFIKIGNKKIKTRLYCRFMGWYLSEGCVQKRKGYNCWQIVISQWGQKLKGMQNDLKNLPYQVNNFNGGVRIYDKELGKYLMQFGKSYEKYIPEEIKKLPKEDIEIFLDAFRLGDGSERISHKWKGGNFRKEKIYSTSSKRLADGIGELILKIGHRPSYNLQKNKGKLVKHKNGIYTSNFDQWIIRECYSQYATKIRKSEIDYNGNVYDIELPKWHTLYVRRNGKCCWSGNCECYLSLETEKPEEE